MICSFAGKRIVVGICGSIAAFKVAGWVSTLSKEEARVSVIMTDSAQKFITPLTFSALTGESTYTSMFDGNLDNAMSHIDLAQDAALVLIAPASAHTISRLAHGMADDLLSATVLATKAKVVICPAMNSNMYLHPATQNNLNTLKSLGYTVVDPESGMMACKDEGPGRLPTWENVKEILLRHLSSNDLTGERILVTAGPTREALDPARFLSNRSSGKMGYAIARAAYRRGAEVILVSGPTSLECPYGVQRINVISAQEMRQEVLNQIDRASIVIKSAAVSDFRPSEQHTNKVKKENASLSLELTQNPDILLEIGQRYEKQEKIIVGFAAESKDIVEEGRKKLTRKCLDLIAVNDICSTSGGFEVDTNKVILIDKQKVVELPLTSKIETADMILDAVVDILNK